MTISLVYSSVIFGICLSCNSNSCKLNMISDVRYGIYKDVPLYMDGKQIGSVEKILPFGDSTLSIVKIDSDIIIPKKTTFKVTFKSILGGSMILLEPSDQTSYYLCGDSVRAFLDPYTEFDSLIRKYSSPN